eukprot:1161262-Pelagomonas_calceolata.AAC.2
MEDHAFLTSTHTHMPTYMCARSLQAAAFRGGVSAASSKGLAGRKQIWWCILRLWGLAVELPVRAHYKADGGACAALRSHVVQAFAGLLNIHNQVRTKWGKYTSSALLRSGDMRISHQQPERRCAKEKGFPSKGKSEKMLALCVRAGQGCARKEWIKAGHAQLSTTGMNCCQFNMHGKIH